MRLLSWNVEDSRRAVPVLPEIVSELEEPDVICLQELRIRASDHVALATFTHALPGYTCHYALPRDPRNVTFRGGRMYGVATFVRDHWQAEVPIWDREGRVLVVQRSDLAIV